MRRLSDWILAAVSVLALLILLDVHSMKTFVYRVVQEGARRRAEVGLADARHRQDVESALSTLRAEIARVKTLTEENKARVEAWQARRNKEKNR